ncbi:restriction endonuclease subunit S [Helicobacter pylori]
MNKIEKLLNELCPNGVEFKSLGEVCEVVKGQQLNKNLLLESGLYPVMNGGINPSGYWDTYNKNAQTITISQGGASAGYVNFMQTPFWAGAHCYTIEKVVEFLNYKFVYYFLKNNQNNLIKSQYGAGIPALNKTDIQTLQIPIPPLEIQEEIVKILDAFTELEAELEADLEARRRQYEYYRNKLLSFEYLKTNGVGYELKMLGEVCEIYDKLRKPVAKDKRVKGDYPYYGANGIQDYVNNYLFEGEYLLIGEDGSVINKDNSPVLHFVNGKFWVNNHAHIIQSKNHNLRFIYYALQCCNIFDLVKGTPPKLNQENLKIIQIPIPPLEVQEKIVSILDKFHALTTDLQSGIPAEIEARKKQYEYYRNQLLTFKEAI